MIFAAGTLLLHQSIYSAWSKRFQTGNVLRRRSDPFRDPLSVAKDALPRAVKRRATARSHARRQC